MESEEEDESLLSLLSLLSRRLPRRLPKRWMLKRFFFFRFLASYAVGGERFLRGKASVCGYDVGKRLLQRAVHAAHVWGAGNGGLRRGRFVHRKRLGPSAKGSAATVGRLHLRLGVKRGAFCLNPMRPIRVNDWNEKGWALLGRLSFPLTGWMRHFSYSVYVTRL